jgi:hypothetical protein
MSDSKLTDFPRRNRCVHHCRQLPTLKRGSKNLQKFLQKIWQGFEKFLAKTSKKDDKQNRLTPLEVRRPGQKSAYALENYLENRVSGFPVGGHKSAIFSLYGGSGRKFTHTSRPSSSVYSI